MPETNEMLLNLEGFQYAMSLDLSMGYYHTQLGKTQVICVRLFFRGENTGTSVYQWELQTHQVFSNRKWMIYFMDLNSSVHI